jgi:8-oxo-dGTP diphosphatase
VAIGLLRDRAGRVLISRRAADVHLPGLWEFPGGKCDPGETGGAALQRELREELGIEVLAATEILVIPHDYPDRSVELRVFRVEAWRGRVTPGERQSLRWVEPSALLRFAFPEASRAVVNAARLPEFYLISPEPQSAAEIDIEVRRIDRRLARGGIGLLQIRAPGLERAPFLNYARALWVCAERHGVEVLVNAPRSWLDGLPGPAGWHLSERRLLTLSGRPDCPGWLAASVHNRAALDRASALPVDFVVAGPVQRTQTHPEAEPLGFQGFADLRAQAACPVFALGGLSPSDLPAVKAAGGQGIAAIRGLLE